MASVLKARQPQGGLLIISLNEAFDSLVAVYSKMIACAIELWCFWMFRHLMALCFVMMGWRDCMQVSLGSHLLSVSAA